MNSRGENALFEAARRGNFKRFKELFEIYITEKDQITGIPIKNKAGQTLLHVAIKHQQSDVIAYLLESEIGKSWCNIPNKAGDTPLHIATQNSNKEVIEKLIQNGANVRWKNNQNNTPLHIAAREGNSKEIIELLCKGLTEEEKNVRNYLGETPLHVALKNSNKDTAILLIKDGADINIKNNKGKNPLDVGVKRLANAQWQQALLEGGIGDAACPEEAVFSILEVFSTWFRNHFAQSLLLIALAFASAGIAVVGSAILFIVSGYREKRISFGQSAQDDLRFYLLNAAIDRDNTIITKYLEGIALLKENINSSELIQAEQLNSYRNKLSELEQRYPSIRNRIDELSTKAETINSQWQKLNVFNSKQVYKFALSRDKRTAVTTGIGKTLGFGSALASLLPAIAFVVGVSSIPVIGWAIGIAGVVALSATIGYFAYRSTLRELGNQNQKLFEKQKRNNELIIEKEKNQKKLTEVDFDALKKKLSGLEKTHKRQSAQEQPESSDKKIETLTSRNQQLAKQCVELDGKVNLLKNKNELLQQRIAELESQQRQSNQKNDDSHDHVDRDFCEKEVKSMGQGMYSDNASNIAANQTLEHATSETAAKKIE